jgi:large subunit ribosomal protein L15
MELHSLKPASGAVKGSKRIARGQGSGRGGTSTRGHKGAKSRSGYKSKRAFEGGQMPLQMRLPKRGFNSPNRTEYVAINLNQLQAISEKYSVTTLDKVILMDLGIVRKTDLIKVLGTGELTTKLTITAHACSATAKAAVEAVGGSVNLV